jgi:hypothetical protein
METAIRCVKYLTMILYHCRPMNWHELNCHALVIDFAIGVRIIIKNRNRDGL